MNSSAIEEALRGYIGRCSVIETVSAQYWMFDSKNGRPPVLMQINRTLMPAYWKEMAEGAGVPLDDIAHATEFGIEKARIQFVGMPAGIYIVSVAPGKEPMTL